MQNKINFISNGNVNEYKNPPISYTLTWKRQTTIIKEIDMQNKILDEYKKAVKENDFWRKKVLTTLRSEIKNLEIMLRPKNLTPTDADILSVIQRIIKQDKESLTMFEEGGRQDLVDATNTEIKILEEFLPKQLTNEEIDDILIKEINKNGYTSVKDMGKLMGYLKSNFSGQIDFGYASKKVKELLNG